MTSVIDPQTLPAVIPVQLASRVLGIGRNQTYALVKAGRYPVRVLDIGGRFRVSKYDLLAYLGAPGYTGHEDGQPLRLVQGRGRDRGEPGRPRITGQDHRMESIGSEPR